MDGLQLKGDFHFDSWVLFFRNFQNIYMEGTQKNTKNYLWVLHNKVHVYKSLGWHLRSPILSRKVPPTITPSKYAYGLPQWDLHFEPVFDVEVNV